MANELNKSIQSEPIQSPKGNDGGVGTFQDRRARLSAKPLARPDVYGPNESSNILHPIWHAGGLMWPYTPIITDNISVNYETYDPTHTNQPFAAFRSVGMKEIMCSGQFTAQNQEEGEYCLAVIHFLRTITKMYFGIGGEDTTAIDLRGTPPPVLLFNAHGTAIFHNVPVIVTSYSIELPQDVDYINVGKSVKSVDTGFKADYDVSDDNTINRADGTERTFTRQRLIDSISAWIPSRFNVTVNMSVQNSPDRLRRNFNLNDFRTGALIKKGGWV